MLVNLRRAPNSITPCGRQSWGFHGRTPASEEHTRRTPARCMRAKFSLAWAKCAGSGPGGRAVVVLTYMPVWASAATVWRSSETPCSVRKKQCSIPSTPAATASAIPGLAWGVRGDRDTGAVCRIGDQLELGPAVL